VSRALAALVSTRAGTAATLGELGGHRKYFRASLSSSARQKSSEPGSLLPQIPILRKIAQPHHERSRITSFEPRPARVPHRALHRFSQRALQEVYFAFFALLGFAVAGLLVGGGSPSVSSKVRTPSVAASAPRAQTGTPVRL
jgi:hypothetical protein